MVYRILSCLVLLAGLVPRPASTQPPLVGVVTDRETSAPLSGVYVALETRASAGEPVLAALTDETGRFVMSVEVGSEYRLRASRVGLGTEITDWFRYSEGLPPYVIFMGEEAVEVEGFAVRGTVRTCRLSEAEATTVHRWWSEARTALETTALVEAGDLARLRFERFEREWSANLRALRSDRVLPADSTSSRPFLSPTAEMLSEHGFVQGREGDRIFFAPDASVLFSATFLEDHCLGIAGHDDEHGLRVRGPDEIQLTVEPAREDPSDIRGVLTVDTLSGELRSFDFTYENLPPDLPRDRAGGHLSFAHLPSGAWVVSDWWIRLPRMEYSGGEGFRQGSVPIVRSYVDQGGRAIETAGRPLNVDRGLERATLSGTVFDNLGGGPLEGARVSIVGSRFATRTNEEGRFTLPEVPVGSHGVTFHHRDMSRMGLPSPVAPVELSEGETVTVALATPDRATVTLLLCGGQVQPGEAILTGMVVDTVGGALHRIRARWIGTDSLDPRRPMRLEGTAGSDGRYVLCGLPADHVVTLDVSAGSSAWREAGEVLLSVEPIVVRDLQPEGESPAVVVGTVRTGDGEEPIEASVSILDVAGDTIASAAVDTSGAFQVTVPPGVGYRVVADATAHAREATQPFNLEGATTLDIAFDLAPDVSSLAMEIEGLMVEIEARNREVARRRLQPFGKTEDSMGRRWIDAATIDALPMAGAADPGVAIQAQGIPRVWVNEGAKYLPRPYLCVEQQAGQCAIVVFNGALIDLETALQIDFRDLDGIALLSPQDATTFYGTIAGGGAVLLWTKGSGR